MFINLSVYIYLFISYLFNNTLSNLDHISNIENPQTSVKSPLTL
jgi:hypothetical protein